MPVRRTLATTLTLLALLAGCGDGSSDGTGSTVSAGGPSEPAAVRATLVHATAGKGAVSDRVSVLEDAAAVQQYAAGFSPVLAARIMRAARSARRAGQRVRRGGHPHRRAGAVAAA
jgi:hypothetical protein